MIDSTPVGAPIQKKRAGMFGAYLIFTVAAALAAAGLQLYLLLTDYDFTLGLYKSGSSLPTVLAALLVAATAVLLTLILTGRKYKMSDALPPVGRGLTFISALTGFAMIGTVVMQLMLGLKYKMMFEGWKSALATGLEVCLLAFALPSALYFIVMALRRDPYQRSTAALGFFPVLWAAAHLMCVYFDASTTFNNPLRILEQAALIAVMLFFLMELRYLIGRAKPLLYLAFGMITLLLIAASSLPTFIMILLMKMDLSVDTIYDAAKLCMAMYIAARLVGVIRARE